MGQLFGGRWRWLGRPAFVACLVVLAVNDHILKQRHPGWWTGKLSDVAGIAMVGTAVAVVLGVQRGLVATGIGFAMLKTVPGVAEAAAPVLGGVTARDRGDLLALGVLVPLGLMLRCSGGATSGTVGPRRPTLVRRGSAARRVSRGVSTAVPLLGAVAALVTATATSCAPDPGVTRVVARGSALYAFIDGRDEDGIWAVSTDGGRTWDRGGPPGAVGRADASESTGGRPRVGPPLACGDGACYRLQGQRVIERRAQGGVWTAEFRLSPEEFDDLRGSCIGEDAGVLASVAVADTTSGPPDPERGPDDPVVASLGIGGALVRTTTGDWERTRVLSTPLVPATDLDRGLTVSTLVFGPVLAAGVWAIGRRRWPSWPTGLAVVAMGWAIAVTATGAASFALDGTIDPLRVTGWMGLGCAVLTAVVAVVVARRPRRVRVPVPHLAYYAIGPTPPPPPPSSPPGDDGWPPPG